MQVPHHIALVLSLLILLPSASCGYDDEIASPVQMMQRVTFKKTVFIENSPEVYSKLSDLTQKHELFNDPAPDMKTMATVAWPANPDADVKKMSFQLREGLSIYQAIELIAKQRGETLVNRRNYVLIRKTSEGEVLKSYQIKSETSDVGLTRWVDALIPPGDIAIGLIHADGNEVEDFINAKLKESLSYSQSKNDGPFSLKIDSKAKPLIANANISGCWCYSDLLDAICAICDLRWKIDGKTLWVGPVPAEAH